MKSLWEQLREREDRVRLLNACEVVESLIKNWPSEDDPQRKTFDESYQRAAHYLVGLLQPGASSFMNDLIMAMHKLDHYAPKVQEYLRRHGGEPDIVGGNGGTEELWLKLLDEAYQAEAVAVAQNQKLNERTIRLGVLEKRNEELEAAIEQLKKDVETAKASAPRTFKTIHVRPRV